MKMTKKRAFNFLKGKKTEVRNRKHNRQIQNILFEAGFTWAISLRGENTPQYLGKPFLIFGEDGLIHAYKADKESEFRANKNEYISPFVVSNIDIMEPNFSIGDKVLVRTRDTEAWQIALFAYKDDTDDYPYYTFGGWPYKECIPFEGNENLLGKKDKPRY